MTSGTFEQGTARVCANNEDWVREFNWYAATILAFRGQFTTDEVVAQIGAPPGHPNAVGAAAVRFARTNGLSVIGYTKTTHASRRTARIAVWGRA